MNKAQNVAEIVSFSLKAGVTAETYLDLMAEIAAFVRNQPGYLAQQVSCGADGRWTDCVTWADMGSAQAAQDAFMSQDFAPRVLAAIDQDTLSMRHEEILWQSAA